MLADQRAFLERSIRKLKDFLSMGVASVAFTSGLFENAFVRLGLPPSASNTEIVEAYEDAVADKPELEKLLTDAKQTLLDPKSRLTAELSYLLDTPPEKVTVALAALRQTPFPTDFSRILATLGPLSCVNFLVCAVIRERRDKTGLLSLIKARARVRADGLLATLNATRGAAGLRGPSLEAVRTAFDAVFEAQVRAMFAAYPETKTAAGEVQSCVEEILGSADAEELDAFDSVLKGYRHRIEGDLSIYVSAVRSAAEKLGRNPSDATFLKEFLGALQNWEQLHRPLQAIENFKGRDDAEARRVFDDVRGLAFKLVGDLARPDIALTVSQASAKAFAKLPRASQQIAEDIKALDERVAAQGADGLARLVTGFADDLRWISASLREYGFGRGASGLAGELYAAFIDAVNKTKGTTASDLPWLLLRSLAIKLNNDGSEPQAAFAIVEGLIDYARMVRPSAEVLTSLDADHAAAKKMALEQRLVQQLQAKSTNEALETLRQLLPLADQGDQRQILNNLKTRLETKKSGSIARLVFFGVVGAIVLIAAISPKSGTNSHYPTTYQAPTYSSPVPTPFDFPSPSVTAPTFDAGETTPPVGSGLLLAKSNIRYCIFQKQRLEFVRVIASDAVLTDFNSAVDDWNSRCSSYRYSGGDLSAVQAEAVGQMDELRQDATRMRDMWMARRAPEAALVPTFAPTPIQLPTPVPTYSPAEPVIAPRTLPSDTSVATSPPLDISPLAAKAGAGTSLNPLLVRDAARVQKRLAELGYFVGQPNGTWGPVSRAALRAFKSASGLSADEGLDGLTTTKLFAADALHASGPPTTRSLASTDFIYPPPPGATLNPLNTADAVRIHGRLRELGFYKGKNDTLWSPASREAIKKFEARNGIPTTIEWDANLEKRLFGEAPP